MPDQYFNKKIVIYGRTTCPYCIGILDYLKKKPSLYKKNTACNGYILLPPFK